MISVTYVVGTLWNCLMRQFHYVPTTYAHLINECFFHHKTGFSQTSQLLFMFQCNMHVEMNKFLCSLACAWMIIIDSQFYIIDSLS